MLVIQRDPVKQRQEAARLRRLLRDFRVPSAMMRQLVNQFIEREDPNTISFEALDKAARQQLDEVTTAHVELTGTVCGDQITFDPPTGAPIIVRGNELIIGGLRLVLAIDRAGQFAHNGLIGYN